MNLVNDICVMLIILYILYMFILFIVSSIKKIFYILEGYIVMKVILLLSVVIKF